MTDFDKHLNRFTFRVNNSLWGNISYFNIKKSYNDENKPQYLLEIHRKVDAVDYRERYDYFTVGSFHVEYERLGLRSLFRNSKLVTFEEESSNDLEIYQKFVFKCGTREILFDGETA